MDIKGEPRDKLLAISGIKLYVDFQLYGTWRNDPSIYKALVYALQDDDEAVREAAFVILKKAHAGDGFGYDAAMGKKQREQALRLWQGWFASACTKV